MLDTIVHKWLKLPYTLNVRENRKGLKAKYTVVFLHGIGNSADAWHPVISKLPGNLHIVTMDLLGFGDSPKPTWGRYDAKRQAQSVVTTLRTLRKRSRVIIVGHSLGSLVAVEIAKNYPRLADSLVLCSPPFYVSKRGALRLPTNDEVLRKLYRTVRNHPERFIQLSQFAVKYNLVNQSFNVTPQNIASYVEALESMIINQTSFSDATELKVPTSVVYGSLDRFVVGKNIRQLQKQNSLIQVQSVASFHELRGKLIAPVVSAITMAASNHGRNKV